MTTRNKRYHRKTKVTKSDDADSFVFDDAATAPGFTQALCSVDIDALTKPNSLSSIKDDEKSDKKGNLKTNSDYASDLEDKGDDFFDDNGIGGGGDGAGKGDDDTGGGGDGAGKGDDDTGGGGDGAGKGDDDGDDDDEEEEEEEEDDSTSSSITQLLTPKPTKKRKSKGNKPSFSVMLPFEDEYAESHAFSWLKETDLDILASGDNRLQNNMLYIDAQLLRIIVPSNDKENQAQVWSKTKKRFVNVNFQRLCLFRCHSPKNQVYCRRLFYIMEGKYNKNVWERNHDFRANGVYTVGCYVRIISPERIDNGLAWDIPLMKTAFAFYALKAPLKIPTISILPSIQANQSLAFIEDKYTIEIPSIRPLDTSCTGLFCDKQLASEWSNIKGKSCGCSHSLHLISKIALDHSVVVNSMSGKEICFIEHFSSNKFSRLYLSKYLPSGLYMSSMQATDAFYEMINCLQNVVNFINRNGGWTCIGWYKRGVISDKALLHIDPKGDSKVASANISFHIVSLFPTRNVFWKGILLWQMNFVK